MASLDTQDRQRTGHPLADLSGPLEAMRDFRNFEN